jgi:hypothetical protein
VADVQPAWQVIPALAYEWLADPPATEEKFRQFISYHMHAKHLLAADMYRCALVQLRNQMGVESIGFMHVAREGESYEEVGHRLRKEAGV